MNRRTKQIGAILALVAMVVFALPVCALVYARSANAARAQRIRTLVEKNPQLQPAWDQAMQDNSLTSTEAQDIEQRAAEKTVPNQ